MAHEWVVALSLIFAIPPVPAASPERAAPTAGADDRYCLRVGPVTGSLIEIVRCWTREKWAEQGVDVDEAWDKNGVGIKR